MSKKLWNRQIKSGESLTAEFLPQIPKLDRLARSFSAFSNSTGGTIYLGVTDEGEPVGLKSRHGTRELVEKVATFYCNPTIEVDMHDWDYLPTVELLVVTIHEAEIKPVYAINPNNEKDTWPFFRSDKENLALDKKSIKNMRKTASIAVEEDFENLDRHTLHILNKLSETPRQTVNQLARSSNISTHRAKKILVELERNGWIHAFFNEKKREYSLTISWKRK